MAGSAPLLRIGGEHVYRRQEHLDYTVPDGFAGSILNLEPATEYECRFELRDLDGTDGQTVQTVHVKTRSELRRTREAPPCTFIRRTTEESAKSRASPACYKPTTAPAWATGVSSGNAARPGDTILIHAGLYKNDRLNYVDPQMTPFDGTMSRTLKGTPEKPITIKSAGDGEVIFDGAGNHRLFDVMASQHHIFEGLA